MEVLCLVCSVRPALNPVRSATSNVVGGTHENFADFGTDSSGK